jgi:6-phosphogluconolactonase/glucosamine-6-phosphate isomerase/deaminase
MEDSYILGLHLLAVASHTPPALSQSAFVFAVATSAAKAGAVEAAASQEQQLLQLPFS